LTIQRASQLRRERTNLLIERLIKALDALLGIREYLDRFLCLSTQFLGLSLLISCGERAQVLFEELHFLIRSLNCVACSNQFFLRDVRVLGGGEEVDLGKRFVTRASTLKQLGLPR
jgi:hypothetical protein